MQSTNFTYEELLGQDNSDIPGPVSSPLDEKILLQELIELQKRFFKILDTVEESDSGKEFRPTYITSCRVMDIQRMNDIIRSMKEIHRRYEGDYSDTIGVVGSYMLR